jgi:hypothetical protein
VPETYPLPAVDGMAIESGVNMIYVLRTASIPDFAYVGNSALSISFIGKSQRALVLDVRAGALPTGNSTFQDLTSVAFQTANELKFNYEGFRFVNTSGVVPTKMEIAVSRLFHCSLDFYETQIDSPGGFLHESVSFAPGATLALSVGITFTELNITAATVSFGPGGAIVGTDFKDVRIALYTSIRAVNITAIASNQFIRGGLSMGLLGDPADIWFAADWNNVRNTTLGPIQLAARSYSVSRHSLWSMDGAIVVVDPAAFTVFSIINTTVCLYLDSDNPCTPDRGGWSAPIEGGKYMSPPGQHYTFTLTPSLMNYTDVFQFAQDSATDIGFSGSNTPFVTLTLQSKEQLTSLNTSVEVTLRGCPEYDLENYVDMNGE